MNRRRLIALLLMLTLAFLFVGCQSADQAVEGDEAPAGGTGDDGGEASDAPVSIRGTVWLNPNQLEALETLTDMYQEDHPNVEVEWVNIVGGGPYGRDKLQTMIAGGDIPDMMMLNTGQFEALAARGILMPLDSFVEEDNFDLSIFWDTAIEGSTYDGTLYALPRDMSDVILYYNATMFDDAGVAYPDENWTWDDLLAAAQALTQDTNGDGQDDQWGYAMDNVTWMWDGYVLGNGGDALSLDRTECQFTDPAVVEGLEFYYGLLTEHGVAPPPGSMPEASGSLDWFTTGAVAMGVYGPWFRPVVVDADVDFEWDVALPPLSPNTGERGTDVYVDHWGMAAATENADATWEFMKFLTGEEAQRRNTELIGARSISPVKAVAQSPDWLSYGDANGQLILDALEFGEPPLINFANSPEAENLWLQELGLVISGDETIQEAAENICPQIEALLPEG